MIKKTMIMKQKRNTTTARWLATLARHAETATVLSYAGALASILIVAIRGTFLEPTAGNTAIVCFTLLGLLSGTLFCRHSDPYEVADDINESTKTDV